MVRKKNPKGLTPSQEAVIKFCESYPEGQYMLDKVAKSVRTKISYSKGCKFLSDFLGKDLTAIVNEYKADVQRNMYEAFGKWEKIFDDLALHLEKLGYQSGSVALYHHGARALINANVPRGLRLQAKSPEAYSRTIAGVTIEDLKQIYNMSDVRERAIITFLKDSGMSMGDFLTLNIGDLKGFEKGESWINLMVYREKEKVEYETFIGPNAVEGLRSYFVLREQRDEQLTSKTPIFVANVKPYERLNENSLSTIFKRIQKRTGITISSHRIRKFFETYMALTVRHPIILKYWMGHKVRRRSRDIEARYIIPPTPEQLTVYKEAYKNIDLVPKVEPEELLKAEIKARMEAMAPGEGRRRFAAELATTYRERAGRLLKDPDIEALLKEETSTNGGSTDCQRIVSEDQLEEHLANGWQVKAVLPSGRIVISNER